LEYLPALEKLSLVMDHRQSNGVYHFRGWDAPSIASMCRMRLRSLKCPFFQCKEVEECLSHLCMLQELVVLSDHWIPHQGCWNRGLRLISPSLESVTISTTVPNSFLACGIAHIDCPRLRCVEGIHLAKYGHSGFVVITTADLLAGTVTTNTGSYTEAQGCRFGWYSGKGVAFITFADRGRPSPHCVWKLWTKVSAPV
jgi:hypothetical protein